MSPVEPLRKITFWSSTCLMRRNGRQRWIGWKLRASRRFRHSMPTGIGRVEPLKILTATGSSSKMLRGAP